MIRAAKSSPLLAEFIGAAVLIAGCGNRSPEPDPAVTAVIAATRYNSPSALAEINRLAALSPAALRAAAVAQIDDPAPAVRDAARYALAVSVTAEDAAAVAALRDLLDADDDAGRLTAAGGLLSIGDKHAVPVLIDLLGSTAKVPFADPPMQVWDVARSLLVTHTDQDLGLSGARDSSAAAASQERWRAWWGSAAGSIEWNASEARFTP